MDNDGRGYQPESAPKTVLQFIQQKYPQANIVEIDQDKGLLKIDGEFYQFNLSSCIRQQNSLTAQFVSFNLSNLANIFYPPQFLQ